ncbi:MAG: hypothetical protein AAGH90_10530 [Pseudomonadota bacterium]
MIAQTLGQIGPDPSHQVQAIMARRPSKEEWIAYDRITFLYNRMRPALRAKLKPLIVQADRRMAKLYAAEVRRIEGSVA